MTALSLLSHTTTKVSAAPAITQPVAPSANEFVVPWHQITPGQTVSQPIDLTPRPDTAMSMPSNVIHHVIEAIPGHPNQQLHDINGNWVTTLKGGEFGNDFWGNGAEDTMIGGAGKDVFHYVLWSDSTAQHKDTIIKFDPTVDKIDLSGLLSAHGNQAYANIFNLPDFNGSSVVHLVVSDNYQYPAAHTLDIEIELTGWAADAATYMKANHEWLIT